MPENFHKTSCFLLLPLPPRANGGLPAARAAQEDHRDKADQEASGAAARLGVRVLHLHLHLHLHLTGGF